MVSVWQQHRGGAHPPPPAHTPGRSRTNLYPHSQPHNHTHRNAHPTPHVDSHANGSPPADPNATPAHADANSAHRYRPTDSGPTYTNALTNRYAKAQLPV